MRLSRPSLPPPPSSSLPPIKTVEGLTAEQIFGHLQALSDLYCPFVFDLDDTTSKKGHVEQASVVDSGYVSETERDGDDADDALSALRADGFEKNYAERWLTGFIARAEMLACFASSEDDCQRALDHASRVLETFFAVPADEDRQMREQLADYARDFSFEVSSSAAAAAALDPAAPSVVSVRLNDGLAGTNSSEPDDVGLQSWGASIIVSRLLCAHPDRFGLTETRLGDSPLIVELGAGTGLVSLVLHGLLPHLGVPSATIVATDYHPAVLDNLRRNITANIIPEEHQQQQRIHTRALDWSDPAPALETAPLDAPADVLIATDVIYAPEHALWLRDCASRLLGPDGVFWLVATVRQNGRFEGVSATVEAAFADAERPRDSEGRRRQLTIVQAEKLEKLVGIGRADESGYKVFRIEWA